MKIFLYVFLFVALLLKPFVGQAQSFTIVDPGPHPDSIEFYLHIINAKYASNNPRNGIYDVDVLTLTPDVEPLFSRTANFTNGEAFIPIVIPYNGVWRTRVRILNHAASEQYINLTTDLSTFTLGNPGTQIAGTPISLSITGAKDYYNVPLSGDHAVTVTGPSGQLFTGLVNFTFGNATVSSPLIVLNTAGSQTLTVSVVGVTASQQTTFTVNPAPASKLVITQQPSSVAGNYNDSPVTLSNVTLQTQDAYGNPSFSGFAGTQNVVVSLANNPGGASLGGTTTVDIQTGTASFSAVTINQEGTGYTLNFASASLVSLTPVTSSAFNVTHLNNISDFTIASPANASTQYQNVDFQMQLSGAKSNTGANLSGAVNVIVSSSTEGTVYNSLVTFTAGSASFALALGNLGAQNLTVTVAGVDINKTLGVTVASDLSGFTVSNPGTPQTYGIPFNLNITGATAYSGISLTGSVAVTVISSISGTVHSSAPTFTGGNATFAVAISALGTHDLTVRITGVTGEQVISGIVVVGDLSTFSIAGTSTSTQTAGVDSHIDITGALSAGGDSLSVSHNVTISSNVNGESIPVVSAAFTAGAASITINLKKAGTHTLTVSIAGVTPTHTHQIVVSAAAASQLVITQQPSGGNGTNNNAVINIGTVIVQTQDANGNLSTLGLSSPQNIVITIANNPGSATLAGTTSINAFSNGQATFSNLTLNKDGVGYTLSIASTGLTPATSSAFNMTNVVDQSIFSIIPPGPQVIAIPFNLQLTNAKDPQGNLLNGQKNVLVRDLFPDPDLTITNTTYLFTNGTASIPITLTDAGSHQFQVFLESAYQTDITIAVTVNGSTMDLALNPLGNQTAGTPFSLDISNAKDATATELSGNHLVSITSNNTSEGTSGLLFSGNLFFTAGSASRTITLNKASSQNLTVTIDWVKDPKVQVVTVIPALASVLIITQQPSSTVNGSNNNTALAIGTVNLEIRDSYGNISTNGFGGAMTLSASITGTPPGVSLGGTVSEVDISAGTASFSNLTLNKNGVYTIAFTYSGTPLGLAPNPVVSTNITMENVENLSGFTVTPAGGTKYANIPFNLLITNAKAVTGTDLSGSINVSITSSISGSVYNSTSSFTTGAATVPLSLAVGTHNLTVTITGVTNSVVYNDLVVVADQSGFTLALNPSGGPFYIFDPFILEISGAKDLDGVNLAGAHNVKVMSNQGDDSIVYNGPANFIAGAINLNLVLSTIAAPHTLTVAIGGVTLSKQISLTTLDNTSNFTLALAILGGKIAGTSFDLSITNAVSLSNVSLNGDFSLTVRSSNLTEGDGTTGLLFSGSRTFTSGSATVPVTLIHAVNQTLTVDIQNITPNQTQVVNLVAATVSKMTITQQPSGATGTSNDAATNIGTTIIRTFDTYDNPSTSGLTGAIEVTASILNNASYNTDAILGGTKTLSISGGTATFNNLTLDKDGAGYTLAFAYSGDPTLSSVNSSAFTMTGVNAYSINLKDNLNNLLDGTHPIAFGTVISGYSPIVASSDTITRSGGGVITGLAVALSGVNAASFTITQPVDPTLDGTPNLTSFTVKPNDGLGVGSYSATVTVTANNGVSRAFNVSFLVQAPFAISLNAANPTIFASVTEGYSQISDATVTITNTGGGTITGLNVVLSGTNPADFVAGLPLATDIASAATTTFTIRPATGLSPGTYSATVTVNNVELVAQSFDVTFTVLAYTYTISIAPSGTVDFGLVSTGYTATPQTMTITRTGTGTIDVLAVAVSSADFEVTQPLSTTITGTPNTTTFTVSPKAGLSAGTYTQTVTVSATGMTPVTFNVTIRVVGIVTWTGSSSSAWHIAGNWDPAVVPDQDSYITIANVTNDPIISSVNVTVNNLLIQSGALLTVNSDRRLTVRSGGILTINPGGNVTIAGTFINNAGVSGVLVKSDASGSGSLIQNSTGVSAKVERYMTGGPNTTDPSHLISSPVSGLSISSFLLTEIAAMRYHNEPTGLWTTGNPGGNFISGKGYAARRGSTSAATFSGTLNVAPLSYSITKDHLGWNCVGNPFTSSLDVTSFLSTNLSLLEPTKANCYYYVKGANPAYQPLGNGANMDPGQGFFVIAQTQGSLSFTSQMQAHDSSPLFYKKSAQAKTSNFTLSVQNSTDSTFTRISFRPEMTKDLDVTWDAGFGFDGSKAGFILYSNLLVGDYGKFIVQFLPNNESTDMIIPIGFEYASGGLVTFTSTVDELPFGYTMILEDRKMGTFADLSVSGTKHEVVLPALTSDTGRFFLHTIQEPNNINLDNKQNISIFAVRKEIFINALSSVNGTASVYDLMGRKIADYRLEPSEINVINADTYNNGVYIVKVIDRGIITTGKIVISE